MKSVGLLVMMIIFVVYLSSLSDSSPVEDTKCQSFCQLNYAPLCATDDEGKTRTFSNLCVMKSENCLRSTNFQKTADGPCP